MGADVNARLVPAGRTSLLTAVAAEQVSPAIVRRLLEIGRRSEC